MLNHIVHITCSDAKGLVSHITGTLFKHGVNVEEMREFVDKENNRFFMRLRLLGEIDDELVQKELINLLPNDAKIKIHPVEKKNIIVLATKEYHCLSDLLIKHHFGELNANIHCVISNHSHLQELTEKFNIPFFYVSHENKSKETFESEIAQIIKDYEIDYLVLAKFMRILSSNFVAQFEEKIINIHHSFLPAFIGANPYRQAFERGVKMIGATAHFVTNDLDEGPIISQKIIPVNHTFTVDNMIEAGHEVERVTLADALKVVFEDRVFVIKNKTVIF